MRISIKHWISIAGWVEIVKGSVGFALFILICLPVFLGLQKIGPFGFIAILDVLWCIPGSFLLIGGLGLLILDKAGRILCLVINYGFLGGLLFVFSAAFPYSSQAWEVLVLAIFILPTIVVLHHPDVVKHFRGGATAIAPKQIVIVIALVGALLLVIPLFWRWRSDKFYSSMTQGPQVKAAFVKAKLRGMYSLAGSYYKKYQKYPASYQALFDYDASQPEHFFDKTLEGVYQKKGYYVYEFTPFGNRFLAVANVKAGIKADVSSYCMTDDGKFRVDEKGRKINSLAWCDSLPER